MVDRLRYLQTVQSLNEAWPDRLIDISDQRPLNLLRSYQGPLLRTVLELNPTYIDTDAGMDLAGSRPPVEEQGQPSPDHAQVPPRKWAEEAFHRKASAGATPGLKSPSMSSMKRC